MLPLTSPTSLHGNLLTSFTLLSLYPPGLPFGEESLLIVQVETRLLVLNLDCRRSLRYTVYSFDSGVFVGTSGLGPQGRCRDTENISVGYRREWTRDRVRPGREANGPRDVRLDTDVFEENRGPSRGE